MWESGPTPWCSKQPLQGAAMSGEWETEAGALGRALQFGERALALLFAQLG